MNRAGDRAHDPDRDRRRAFRRFVRTHHPDVGGDPNVFTAGLAGFSRGATAGHEQPRSRGDKSRYDAPLVFVHRPRGLRRLLVWLADRRAARNRPRRVH